MVGDDIESDVLGAQACSARRRVRRAGVFVRTGESDQAAVQAAPGRPDHVPGSFAELPALLGTG